MSGGPYRNLRIARDGAVLRVTLARPEVRNAFDDVLIEELTRAFSEARDDSGVRVVVLAGEGPTFCAGADVNWMRKAGGYSKAENEADADRMARMLRGIDSCPKPVIALAHGAAIGGGVGLVAAADIAIAAEGTVFSLAEVKLGILPAVVSPFVLRAIGPRVGAGPLSDGRPFRRRARRMRIGLVHQVVPAEDLGAAGDAKRASLLAAGPEAVMVAKALIAEVAWKSPDDVATPTVRAIAERRASEEAREGLTAFLEKRKPSWAAKARTRRGREEMKGTQRRMVCEKCGKVFFAWRPEELPGAQVKCYFCGHTFADDAAKRPPFTATGTGAGSRARGGRGSGGAACGRLRREGTFVKLGARLPPSCSSSSCPLSAARPRPADRIRPARPIEKLTGPSSRMEPDLRKLTDDIGGRVTGSAGYEQSLQWGIDAFRRAGVDSVKLETYPVG